MHPRSKRAVGLLLALLFLAGTAACASDGSRRSAPFENPTTTLDLTPAGRRYGVGRIDVTFVDPTRSTPADPATEQPARPDRTLPTVVLYPTAASSTDPAEPKRDAPMADGHFPLFVFVHGRTGTGPLYVQYLERVAAAGYVVALPTMPLTSGAGADPSFAPVVDQPADVRFLIDRLIIDSGEPGNVLYAHLDPSAVAVGGHSLGAITALFFTNSCCRDPQVKAVVAASGQFYQGPDPSDTYAYPPPDLPLLLLHGKKDLVIPFDAGSAHVFRVDRHVPRALVTFPDAGHVDLLESPSFEDATIAFLDLVLRHDATRWHRLSTLLTDNGDASVRVAGGLSCPVRSG